DRYAKTHRRAPADGGDRRVPVGLTYIFDGAPLDIFFEIVPILDLIPDTEFDANAAIGIRFYFGGVATE
ncbi:MAG: hypothetical protein H6Q78_1551, partial [Candidatus Krumholzibacteriota bacterium]|nr:hypothetical protein [Candidatus Krumholzibacteriota bacterium]